LFPAALIGERNRRWSEPKAAFRSPNGISILIDLADTLTRSAERGAALPPFAAARFRRMREKPRQVRYGRFRCASQKAEKGVTMSGYQLRLRSGSVLSIGLSPEPSGFDPAEA
jgi:hypothetical protein